MFDVDLTTGHLTLDDSDVPYPLTARYIHADKNLLVNGYGLFSLQSGHVMVEDSPFLQPDRTFTAYGAIYMPDLGLTHYNEYPLTADDIVKFTSDIDIADPIGATPSARFTLVLNNSDGKWGAESLIKKSSYYNGAIVKLTIGASDSLGAYTYREFGTFEVQSYYHNAPTITLIGSDFMSTKMETKFIVPWVSGDFPMTLYAILENACEQAGVEINVRANTLAEHWQTYTGGIFEIPLIPTMPECTCRDVVGWLAALHGGFAFFDPSGKLIVKTYAALWGAGGAVIDASQYYKLNQQSNLENINTIAYLYEYDAPAETAPKTNSIVRGAGLPYYVLEIRGNPFFKYGWNNTTMFSTIMYFLLHIAARQNASVTWNGGEEVEIGEVLVLTTPNGSKVQIDIFGQRVKYETGIVYETWRNYSPELKRVL